MTEAITIQNLVKYYPDKFSGRKTPGIKAIGTNKFALDNLNISIPLGSIYGLLGPNGAGKSTLINILAGTVIKTSGRVEIMGINIDDQPKKARSMIGIVPQEVFIDSFFPISQLLEFTAGYFGIKAKDRKTDELLKALSLYDKKDNLPKSLSGGMRRRFLIAKALAHSPKILVLDEPTAGVDIELRNQLWSYIRKLNSQGTAIIITTHYLAEAQEICDRIAFINQGKIVSSDTKDNLLKDLGLRYLEVEFSKNFADRLDESELKNKFGSKMEIVSGNRVRFYLDANFHDFTALFNNISLPDNPIKDLHIKEPNIEEIFHKIIK